MSHRFKGQTLTSQETWKTDVLTAQLEGNQRWSVITTELVWDLEAETHTTMGVWCNTWLNYFQRWFQYFDLLVYAQRKDKKLQVEHNEWMIFVGTFRSLKENNGKTKETPNPFRHHGHTFLCLYRRNVSSGFIGYTNTFTLLSHSYQLLQFMEGKNQEAI